MNAIFALAIGVVAIGLGYFVYAKSINTNVIQPDDKKATPAKMYMDGVDFTPSIATSCSGTSSSLSQLWGLLQGRLWQCNGAGCRPSCG